MLTPAELGRRLRAARDSCGLTQEDVAAELSVSRSTVAQIEAGNRGVSGIELGKLAFLFGRDMRELLATEYEDADPLGALFRAEAEVSGDDVVVRKLRECVALGRELTNLERLVGIDRDVSIAATYPLAAPSISDRQREIAGSASAPAPLPTWESYWRPRAFAPRSSYCPRTCRVSRSAICGSGCSWSRMPTTTSGVDASRTLTSTRTCSSIARASAW